MKVDKFKRIGKHHLNHCQDSVGIYEIGSDRYVLLVCDGCSMGNDSHYVSELIQKIIKFIAKEESYRELALSELRSLGEIRKVVLQKLFVRLQEIYQTTGSDKYDYLATVVLMIVDSASKQIVYTVIGDGVIAIDNQILEFDQQNKPDYIGYHLDKDFQEWYSTLNQQGEAKWNRSVSVATDGIMTLTDGYDNYASDDLLLEVTKDLLTSLDIFKQNQIQNKIDKYHKDQSLAFNDDIAIARLQIE